MRILLIALMLFATTVFSAPILFEPRTSFQSAFSPNGEGQSLIVSAIDGAKETILVQAYSFT